MRKKNKEVIESLDDGDFEEEGFIEGEVDFGNAVASFNFATSENVESSEALSEPKLTSNTFKSMNDTCSTTPRGITPPIDGEVFTVKRCYQFRPSTVRKLNELKANHPNINAYLNTIIDEAIQHYHHYIFNDNGTFKEVNQLTSYIVFYISS